jgi:tetratricopeptide (TPR) repeat protein
MEYVRGRPLLEYAAAAKLSVRDRLALVAELGRIVQYAHQHGVIHRDLKPANVLIDDDGRPRILDFGVARSTNADVQSSTLATEAGQLVGTIGYMSPEQLEGDPTKVDARADVYALGVIAYELLAGRLPHDVKTCSIAQAARLVMETEPTPLRIANPILRGDVDVIVSTALARERERRYQTATDLALDVERYLADEPISARPAGRIYRFRKFARRNRVAVAALAAVFLVMVAATIISVTNAVAATNARDDAVIAQKSAEDAQDAEEAQRELAEKRLAVANAVNQFLNDDLLGQADPYQQANRALTLREALDHASETIGDRLDDAPVVRGSIHFTVGRLYRQLGEFELAEPHLREAVALLSAELGEDDEQTLEARNALGAMLWQAWRPVEAEAYARETMRLAMARHGREHEEATSAMNDLAVALKRQGRFEEAESYYRAALEIEERVQGEADRGTQSTMNNLALLLADRGEHEEAEELMRRVLEIRRRVYGEEDPDTAYALVNLGHVLWLQNEYDEMEPLWTRAYEIRQRVLGETHPETLRSLYALGLMHSARKDDAMAEQVQREALRLREQTLDEDHQDVMSSRNAVAVAIANQGRHAEAVPRYRELLTQRQRVLGAEHRETRRTRDNLLDSLRALGRHDEAKAVVAERLALMEQTALAPDADARTVNAWAWTLLTCEYEELRDYELGLQQAQRAAELTNHADPQILDTLAVALERNDRLDEAIEVQRQALSLVPDDNERLRGSLEETLNDLLAKRDEND